MQQPWLTGTAISAFLQKVPVHFTLQPLGEIAKSYADLVFSNYGIDAVL